jgi:isopentenyl diphosphate isomerase/L-lactate dehydrogenase-like FMN-dependent dehydrogenase
VLKGVQCYEDAKIAAKMGLHVWVSNHGGRISDSIRTSIEMLPECVMGVKEAGNPSIEVYVDGGIRKGSDVLKCIALGARCVFLGRS